MLPAQFDWRFWRKLSRLGGAVLMGYLLGTGHSCYTVMVTDSWTQEEELQ